eukprot:TRINITY_DN5659_c0_g1_i3.p1 TRINITY_DN5659_c0_g1~~TRINITY_DN5659_c0_g1_i3.p1  ORF type:complete len:261 (+),score=33.99 TRINITY_DN5659_c0_g1_i3:470-1252(+)
MPCRYVSTTEKLSIIRGKKGREIQWTENFRFAYKNFLLSSFLRVAFANGEIRVPNFDLVGRYLFRDKLEFSFKNISDSELFGIGVNYQRSDKLQFGSAFTIKAAKDYTAVVGASYHHSKKLIAKGKIDSKLNASILTRYNLNDMIRVSFGGQYNLRPRSTRASEHNIQNPFFTRIGLSIEVSEQTIHCIHPPNLYHSLHTKHEKKLYTKGKKAQSFFMNAKFLRSAKETSSKDYIEKKAMMQKKTSTNNNKITQWFAKDL